MEQTIGVIIGAFIALIGTIGTQWLQAKRERDQWEREQEIERQRRLEERIQKVYENCIEYLGAIHAGESKWTDFATAKKWVTLLMAYHPSKGSEEYEELLRLTRDFAQEEHPENARKRELTYKLLESVVDLAKDDPRLQLQPRPTHDSTHN